MDTKLKPFGRLSCPEVYGTSTRHRYLGYLPFYHIAGLGVFAYMAPFSRVPTVVMPRFDFAQALQLVARHQITMLHVVPPIALLLAKSPEVDRYDLKTLTILLSGAAALGRELQISVESRLNIPCIQAYGATEASGEVSLSRLLTEALRFQCRTDCYRSLGYSPRRWQWSITSWHERTHL